MRIRSRPKVSADFIPSGDAVGENPLTYPTQAEILGDLKRILDRLDELELFMAGAYVASAIDAIEKSDALDQVKPEF